MKTLLQEECDRRAAAQKEQDHRTRMAKWERQMITGEQHSPSARRIIAQMRRYAPQATPPDEQISKKDVVVFATEMLMTDGLELVPDAPVFTLPSAEEQQRYEAIHTDEPEE